MVKKPLQSRQQRLLKSEKWRPYVRYQKETDTWIAKAIREEPTENGKMEKNMEKIVSKIRILMEKDQLDIIARIVAYLYHDKVDELKESASDLRKEYIYKDLRSIDQWLSIQYNRLQEIEDSNKKINQIDKEIKNEQSEQDKGKYL